MSELAQTQMVRSSGFQQQGAPYFEVGGLPLGASQLGGGPMAMGSFGGLPTGPLPGAEFPQGTFGTQAGCGFPGTPNPVEAGVKPEEPARYITELPKLVQADLATSAIVCGNWLAQIRQIFQGLSPSADVWFSSVEEAASRGYSRWLVADPLGRVGLDPASITASFDPVRFQRVESRAVSLLLNVFFL